MCFWFVHVLVTTTAVFVLICAVDKAPEESLKKTIEVDRLIGMVSDANPREVNAIYIFNQPCNYITVPFLNYDCCPTLQYNPELVLYTFFSQRLTYRFNPIWKLLVYTMLSLSLLPMLLVQNVQSQTKFDQLITWCVEQVYKLQLPWKRVC